MISPFSAADNPKLINFKYFFTRKLIFIRHSDAIALFPGGFGTMDEGYEALTLMQTGKSQLMPLVLIDRPGGTYWKTWDKHVREHLLRDNGLPILKVDRGGQVTYHGPGQLIAYTLFDLRRPNLGIRDMVRRIEAAVVQWLDSVGISAFEKGVQAWDLFRLGGNN